MTEDVLKRKQVSAIDEIVRRKGMPAQMGV
jgi:hypothetical protein